MSNMKLSFFCLSMIAAVISGFSFPEKEPASEKLFFIDLMTQDTLYQTAFYPQMKQVEFHCGARKKKYDAAVLMRVRNDGKGSVSIIVPLAAEATNTYTFNKEKNGLPLYYMNGDQPVHITFSGNNYLNDYSNFLNDLGVVDLSSHQSDTLKAMAVFVNDLYDLNQKYPASSIVAFHLYNLELQDYGKFIETKLSKKEVKKWKTLQQVDDGFFSKEMKRVRDAQLGLSCKNPGPETFVLQSAVYTIDESLLKENVKVVVFWATWCGPCKPVMKQFADWNTELYADKAVIFIGVTSESNTKMLFDWEAQHPEYKGLTFFQDTHLCMKTNYNIQQYPTILIFNKEDKLVVRDPDLEQVKPIVDSLLQL